MGIVKISEQMHGNLRLTSGALSRSINAQAEHWLRVGMLSELNPNLRYGDICQSITALATELDAPITPDEFRTLNRCLDEVIAEVLPDGKVAALRRLAEGGGFDGASTGASGAVQSMSGVARAASSAG